MQFDWSTLALQTVNFIVLVLLLQHFLYKPVLARLDARRAEIDASYAAAKQAQQQAQQELESIAEQRRKIASERSAALEASAAQAEQAAAERRRKAEREADELLAQSRKTLADERHAALEAARVAAVDLGVGIARRLLDSVPAALRNEATLEAVERYVEHLEPSEQDALRESLRRAPLRIVTAQPLEAATAEVWREQVARLAGQEVDIEFANDAALLAGAELHLPDAILRFSWRDALEAIKTELNDRGDAA